MPVLKQKTLERIQVLGPLLRNLPLADRIAADLMMAEALGHSPNALLCKVAANIYDNEIRYAKSESYHPETDYWRAAILAVKLGLGKDKVKAAALKACDISVNGGDVSTAVEIAKEFGLKKEAKAMALEAYKQKIVDKNYSVAKQIADCFSFDKTLLKELALKEMGEQKNVKDPRLKAWAS